MTAYTSPKTYSSGSQLTAAELNTSQDNIKNLDERLTLIGATSTSSVGPLKTKAVGAGAYRDTSVALPLYTWLAVPFNTGTTWGPYPTGVHSLGTDPEVWTIPSTGLYLITYNVWLQGCARALARIWNIGAGVAVQGSVTADDQDGDEDIRLSTSVEWLAAADNTVRFEVYAASAIGGISSQVNDATLSVRKVAES